MAGRSGSATFRTTSLEATIPELRVGRPDLAALCGAEFQDVLAELPAGGQVFWGIPFDLLPATAKSRWLWLGETAPVRRLTMAGAHCDYIVLAHFAIPARATTGRVERPGELLARYVLEAEDGTEHVVPIRRRFEVNDAWLDFGQLAFSARPHRQPVLLDWRGPHGDQEWGRNQQTSDGSPYGRDNTWLANYWIYAIPMPGLARSPLLALRLESVAGWIGVGGVTLFSGEGDPLHHGPLETVRITHHGRSPDASPSVAVDLGLLGHSRSALPIDPGEWLNAEVVGWGSAPVEQRESQVLVEVAASRAATLTVDEHPIPLGPVLDGRHAFSSDRTVRVELLPAPVNWVRVRIVDKATGQPTPARVHFRAADGRYLPPYGHRHEVNDRWFEDYGADLLLGATPYAYVGGELDIELPTGPVYAEVVKGFDYRPVRARIEIQPGQRDLTIAIERPADHIRAGWITADTHVHFLSPQTAWLEGQAEDINVVNLLATQWGDLYTSVADYTGSPSGVSRDDTIVWVGTENRQHFLGHMNLLGTRGETVGLMCAGGPPESFIGDPVWTSMADWADRGRREGGLVVVPHFPMPYSEVVADVALGKIDGVEVRDFGEGVDSFAVGEWYRLLNAGFRVAVVGGTDKMSAGMPLGGVRTYTRVGDRELSFETWAAAVRAGRTITSTGPFIDLRVDGRGLGDEIVLPGNGGTLTVEAVATCFQPLRRLEIVHDGKVVAATEPDGDRHRLAMSTTVHANASGWIAARCEGPDTLWHVWRMRPAAHTSPIYLVGANTLASGPAADLAYLQTIVEGGLTWLDGLATRADPATHLRLRQTFLDAQRVLSRRTE